MINTMMNIYLLSARGLWSSVSHDPLFELEDILLQTCDAQLLVTTARGVKQLLHNQPKNMATPLLEKIINRTVGNYNPINYSFPSSDRRNVLFIIGLNGADLYQLSSLPRWRKNFDLVVAYIFDAWDFNIYPKYTHLLDHLFVPMPEIIEPLQKNFGIPVSLLPFGADVLTHGSDEFDRPFDLTSYGRIPEKYHRAFSQKFNNPDSKRIYYRSTPRPVEQFPKRPYEERRDREDVLFLFKILRKTKLALAFDTMYPGMRRFPYSFVTLRWFECGGAGCAIIGKRPTTPLSKELLSWEDATIELPDDPQESTEFIENLLDDRQRLEAIHKRNYLENLTRHDWRLRIKSMLDQLNIPLPERLVDDLSKIKTLHTQLSRSVVCSKAVEK